MEIRELNERLRPGTLLSLARKYNPKKISNDQYRINPCPVCGHKDHFTIYGQDNSYCSFSQCTPGGNVFNFLTEIEGRTKDEAREVLEGLAGVLPSEPQKMEIAPVVRTPEQVQSKDYTQYINKLYNEKGAAAKDYFINRGIGQNLVEQYKLSIFEGKDGQRAMLPVWCQGKVVYYTGRAIDGQEPKYKNATGSAEYFNIEELEKAQSGDIIIITEGILDSLSVEEVTGIKAVSLGGVNHYSKISEKIEEAQARGVTVLSAFDNDEPGKSLTERAALTPIIIPKEHNDINEWIIKDREEASEGILTTIETYNRPNAASYFLENNFLNEIENFKQYQGKETGFNNLDYHLGGFFPGLYVLGGVSSVGKTTFAHQLGDQLAERGEHVLYFSLEQSTFEMISKSIARETANIEIKQGGDVRELNEAITNINIRSGYQSKTIQQAIENYKETASRVSIIEGNFNLDVKEIKKEVERYISRNNVRPVVIIDYLQVIPGDPKMNDKMQIDSNVTELKRLSRDKDIPVIAISSFNRASYASPVTFEAFKESGGIEYTADVVIGLQLQAVREKVKGESMEQKQDRLRLAKEAIPRAIDLVCLKNRNGRTFSCSFNYNPMFDIFKPQKLGTIKTPKG